MLMEGPVQTSELVLNVPLMSKARPRSCGRSFLMPPAYKKWKKEVRAQMAEWWVDEPLELVYLVRMTSKARARISTICSGPSLMRGTPDLEGRPGVGDQPIGWEHQKAKTTEQQIVLKLIYPDK